MPDFISELSTLEKVLCMGIVWVSGVLLYVLKKHMASYEKNADTMKEVAVALKGIETTMKAVDARMDTSAKVDQNMLVVLAEIQANSRVRSIPRPLPNVG